MMHTQKRTQRDRRLPWLPAQPERSRPSVGLSASPSASLSGPLAASLPGPFSARFPALFPALLSVAKPRENDAPHRESRGAALGTLTVLLTTLLILSAGCSTAHLRDRPRSLSNSENHASSERSNYLAENTRSGNLYRDYRSLIIANVLFKDLTYRELWLEEQKELGFATQAQIGVIEQRENETFDQRWEFLIVAFRGDKQRIDLDDPDSPWRLVVQDDDGKWIHAIAVKQLHPRDAQHRYLKRYWSGVDPWSRIYQVSFPKLAKGRLSQPLGGEPFRLVMAGVEGRLSFAWENPSRFYRPLSTQQTAARTSAREARP